MRSRSVLLLIFICAVAVAYAVSPKGASHSGARGVPAPTASNFTSVASDLVIVNTTLGEQQAQAAGTGIVLSQTGEVLTNNHVIAGATAVRATDVGNGRTYTATVTGYDRSHDVAVLNLHDATGLSVASLGTGSRPAVGDRVAAVGNAGGTGRLSTSPGVVSALNQSVVASDQGSGSSEQLTGLIRVNANVRPGDSGGPLVDSSGRVLGITTAAGGGFSFQQGGSAGYAIPIDGALPIRSLIDAGQTTGTVHVGPTAQLGVIVGAAQSGSGSTVIDVLPGQPAADAGIIPGDTITSLGGTAVDGPTALVNQIDRYQPGRSVALAWIDQAGRSHSATVALTTGPAG